MGKQYKEIVDLSPSKLKPHPINGKLYRLRTTVEIEDLAKDLEKNGQTEPVEITPDREIISGHCRVLAATLLGWRTVACRIRRDLADAGPDAVVCRLIEANLNRRHLSRLDLVRSYYTLKQHEKGRRARSTCRVKGQLNEILAKRFTPPMSGRTLNRWFQVLGLPMPLQQAVDQSKLPLMRALKIAALSKPEQAEIAKNIEAGKPIAEVVAKYLEKSTVEKLSSSKALTRLIASLESACGSLGGRIQEIERIDFSGEIASLREGRKLIDALIARIGSNKERKV